MDDEMRALDEYFNRVEAILRNGEAPDKITREMRDSLLFYTAHQTRITNGNVKDNKKEIRIHRWMIAVLLILIAWHAGIPFLPFP